MHIPKYVAQMAPASTTDHDPRQQTNCVRPANAATNCVAERIDDPAVRAARSSFGSGRGPDTKSRCAARGLAEFELRRDHRAPTNCSMWTYPLGSCSETTTRQSDDYSQLPPGSAQICAKPHAPHQSACDVGKPCCTNLGAGEGNRTLVFSLEGCCSTIELHPQKQLLSVLLVVTWRSFGSRHFRAAWHDLEQIATAFASQPVRHFLGGFPSP